MSKSLNKNESNFSASSFATIPIVSQKANLMQTFGKQQSAGLIGKRDERGKVCLNIIRGQKNFGGQSKYNSQSLQRRQTG